MRSAGPAANPPRRLHGARPQSRSSVSTLPRRREASSPSRLECWWARWTTHVTVRATGPVDVVGVRFHPSGAHPLFRFSMAELANRLVPLEDVVDLSGMALERELRSRAKAGARRESLAAIRSAAASDPGFERAVASVVEAEGRISVDGLARTWGSDPGSSNEGSASEWASGRSGSRESCDSRASFGERFLDERALGGARSRLRLLRPGPLHP